MKYCDDQLIVWLSGIINMLPLDCLVLIAKYDLQSYRSMLAIPRFARYTIKSNKEFRRHFTVLTKNFFGNTEYRLNGMIHREDDLPAEQSANGFCAWYWMGKLHRGNDLPAKSWTDGDCEWYRDGKLHRDNDQPALIFGSGYKMWYRNNLLHRDGDRPAKMSSDGKCEWWRNGKRYYPAHPIMRRWTKVRPPRTYN